MPLVLEKEKVRVIKRLGSTRDRSSRDNPKDELSYGSRLQLFETGDVIEQAKLEMQENNAKPARRRAENSWIASYRSKPGTFPLLQANIKPRPS